MKHITLLYNRTNISFEKCEFDEIGMFCELGQFDELYSWVMF